MHETAGIGNIFAILHCLYAPVHLKGERKGKWNLIF